ncbi:MAG: restriction endonuclease subunit S [Pseudomonadota bacterium]|nr:restriction endonuclease subunit S [Pseudomonadota bacterium]
MIDGLKPYPTYKDSGVPWLGEVPGHWEVLPHRALFNEVKDCDHPDEQMLSVTITRGVIKQGALLAGSSKKDSSKLDKSAYKLVCPGDITYNKMRAWQGAVGVSDFRGIVSPAYIVVRLHGEHNPRYFHHIFRTPSFAKEAERWSYGITSDMWSLRPEHFKMIYGCLPPLPEQSAIVRFLDQADRRIRRYIHAKQKLIKLLEEQKEAIIHRAVTRGFDPNVRLKPSGVEWLGDVPEHWEVVRFKRRIGFQEGPGIMAADFRDEGVPLLRISCVRWEFASLEGCNFLDPEMVRRRWSHFAVRAGDYLLSASASTGSVCLATDVVVNAIPYTGILRLWTMTKEAFMPFVRLYMGCRPFQQQIDAAKSGVGIEHFGPTHLKRMFITLPPPKEQQGIVAAVADKIAPFAAAIQRAHREISLLREYRTRLIADVVTGKLDVREAAVRLPDEVDDPEPLQDTDTLLEGDNDTDEADLDAVRAEA